MAFNDPLRGRQQRLPSQIPPMAAAGRQYVLMPELPAAMEGHTLGAQPVPQFGVPLRATTFPANLADANQPYLQQPFTNNFQPQAPQTYGASPAARYMAATQAAAGTGGQTGGQTSGQPVSPVAVAAPAAPAPQPSPGARRQRGNLSPVAGPSATPGAG